MLAPQRLALSGPTLVRLLARFGDAEVPESRQSISDHLSQWLGWTDAIALSTALSSTLGVQTPGGEPAVRAGASVEQGQSEQVRAALRKAIVGEGAPARRDGRRTQAAAQPADVEPDFADFRQRYVALQQAMETDIATLRARLRAALAARAPALARLATVDAVMEQALGARERSLLAGVPALLGAHFERQRAAAAAECAAESAAPHAWLAGFRKDMQSVLLAELEIRFQPVEGLLAALRTS
ncbi:DUF3348 domain-containing protein [Paraburkholderia sp. J76]|uniref:DUF3348 domain-containing protein n=1 Tax=Paraburkholderia sp. J76 TaxID=2805439 RepID=UPI002ABD68B9|nr:DUF3348 domain-containing protein [Paraburkholderia sp. J76]